MTKFKKSSQKATYTCIFNSLFILKGPSIAETFQAAAVAAAAAAVATTDNTSTPQTTMVTYRSSPFAETANTGTTCNPHGIDNILNKRGDLPAKTSSVDPSVKLARLSDDEVVSKIGEEAVSLSSLPDAISEDPHKQHVQTSCWPGFQGIITNPTLWRDRAYLQGKRLPIYITVQLT